MEGDSGKTPFATSKVLSKTLLTDFLTFLAVSLTVALTSPSGDIEPVLMISNLDPLLVLQLVPKTPDDKK
jgi:hypothetical protein